MERRYGLGLRAQILIALSAAFAVSFTGLGIVVMQVTRHAQEIDRLRRADATAQALAVAVDAAFELGEQPQMLARVVGRAGVIGVAAPSMGVSIRFGKTSGPPDAITSLSSGERLSVWTLPSAPHAAAALGALLRLYLFLTGIFILLIAYVALTRLIVRPVENLTHAAERLGSGKQHNEVPVGGAAEIASLAVSFNRMARELRAERSALEARLVELERATTELRNTQDQLVRSEKLASVGRLAAGIAHEIGNPLAAILGLVEILQLGSIDPVEQAEFLRRIGGETERIHRIIRELLDYSRNQTAAAAPDAQTDLVSVVEMAVKLIAPQYDLRRINIERRFESESTRVRGSADELSQVVLNLLLNAADAIAGEGNILIEVASDDDGDAVLTVTDSGPGIAESVRDKLFEPFVTTKPAGKGTGLGLAVCHALAARYGGSIHADNGPHGGARFIVRLKAAKAPS